MTALQPGNDSPRVGQGRFYFQKKAFQASEQRHDDVARQRKRWRRWMKRVNARRLVFLDESGARTNRKRLYGRAAKGERIVDDAPGARWETTTMLAAIRVEGISAAMVTRRAINAVTFLGWGILSK